MGRVA